MHSLPATTSSEQTFQTIKSWIGECLIAHEDCARPYNSQSELNKILAGIRFLHIRGSCVVLVENVQPLHYAALSHCWGSGTTIVKTLESNISDHKGTGLVISYLPKTFRDAVQICQRLDIDYVWIDSLCIIQDDPSNWRTQASRMEDVYANSYVTLAASKAKDPSEGMFSDCHWAFRGCQLPGYPGLMIRQIVSPPGTEFRDKGYARDGDWPLYSRGWIYQELTISPRVVHFGLQEVMWNCASRRRGQSHTNKFYDMIATSVSLKRFHPDFIQQQWYLTIEAYSWRALTFHKDRLPAIAALAKRRQTLCRNGRYLAGLWEETLLSDLLWECRLSKVHGGSSDRVSPESDNMPSWSWAKLQRGVRWSSVVFAPPLNSVEILDVNYETKGPAVSGDIQNAFITLRAPLIRLVTLSHRHQALAERRSRHSNDARNTVIQSGDLTQLKTELRLVLIEWRWDHDMSFVVATADARRGEVYGVPLLAQKIKEASDFVPLQLLLMVRKTKEPGRYRRVGVARVTVADSPFLQDSATPSRGPDWGALKVQQQDRLNHWLEQRDTEVITLI